MHTPLLITALLLFASMFVPLPSPIGLAVSLWALGEGVPLPAVLLLYLLQDLLTYAAIGRLLPQISRRFGHRFDALRARVPRSATRLLGTLLRPAIGGEAGLFSVALLSFYAGTALATLQRSAPVRSAAIVIGADVARYVNGLAVAMGATMLLPAGPLTIATASLAGFVGVVLLRGVTTRSRPSPAVAPARIDGSSLH